MSTVVKDLGAVTAYADAVAAGYTGTKEEWQTLMASYASVAEEAQEAREGAEAAQDAAEDARDAAISAKTGAESAVSGFGTVVTQATNQAVQTVQTEGTTQVGNVSSEGTTQVNAVQAKGTEVIQSIPEDYTELSNDVSQLKQDLTAEETAREAADTAINATLETKADADTPIATAEQLLSDKYTTDQEPYTFRASGSNGADREYDELVGGSIVWNQLCNSSSVTIQNGHKYYMLKGGTASIGASTGSAITGLTSGTDMVSDLTQMFGSTIADYIYSLEQTTAGAGVAWFKQLFSENYYPYDAGTMKHVEGLSAHVMRDSDENVIGNYPLDDSLTLRGIPKLDSNNQMYYNGDTYAADGTVTRRYGIVDLGTLTWVYDTATEHKHFFVLPSNLPQKPKYHGGLVCPKFIGTTKGYATINNLEMCLDNSEATPILRVRDDSYTDAASFKTAMSGVMLVYELATPTTETATPFTNPQVCDPYGTEEYVSTSLVPVGHYTKYPANLRSAIERVMEQVPEAPSANGTYTLKATRTSSGVTYAWTAE